MEDNNFSMLISDDALGLDLGPVRGIFLCENVTHTIVFGTRVV